MGDAHRLVTRKNRWVALLILPGHLLFLFLALWNQSFLIDDSIQYLSLSENLLQNGVFSQSYFADLSPDLQRSPGYPLLLAICGNVPAIVLVLQHLLVLATGYLLFRLLLLFQKPVVARFGAFFWLLQPYPIVLSSYILSESAFIFFSALGLYFYLRWRQKKQAPWYAWIGFLGLVIAIYMRPVGLATLLLVVLDGIIILVRQRNWLPIIGLVLLPILTIGPWMARNYQQTGESSFSSMGRMAMLHGRLGGILSMDKPEDEHQYFMAGDSLASQHIGFQNLRTYLGKEESHETELLPPEVTKLTIGHFIAHPRQALQFSGRSLFQMLKGVGYGWTERLGLSSELAWVTAIVQLGFNLLMYLGILICLLQIRRWQGIDYLMMLIILGQYALSLAIWADGRYRMPIDFTKVVKIFQKPGERYYLWIRFLGERKRSDGKQKSKSQF